MYITNTLPLFKHLIRWIYHHLLGFARALYEGFCAAFLTSLSRGSYETMQLMILQHIGEGISAAHLKHAPPCPGDGVWANSRRNYTSRLMFLPYLSTLSANRRRNNSSKLKFSLYFTHSSNRRMNDNSKLRHNYILFPPQARSSVPGWRCVCQ